MIFFLHPLGSDPSYFDDVRSHLAGMTTVAPDLADFVPAVGPPTTLEDVTDRVAEQIRGAGDGAVTVAGVSLGGLIALDLAARHADTVERLLVCDSVAVYPEHMIQMWEKRARVARDEGLVPFLAPTLDLWFTEDFRTTDHDRVRTMVNVFSATDPEYYARLCEMLAQADLRERAAGIAAKTLLVCGSQDAPAFTQAASWLSSQIAVSQLAWIDGAKHAATLERSEQFAALIEKFESAASPTS